MRTTLLLHVLAGGTGLLSGYVALYATKGASLHRKVGLLFVCVMLTMAVTGLLISAIEGIAPAINIPTALLTSYLVITSLATVRPIASSWLDRAALLLGIGIAIGCFALAGIAIANGGAEAGLAYPLVMFAVAAGLAVRGDVRMIRAGGLRGRARLTRHLWRMCFALFIASIAFFLGPDRLPLSLRHPALRAGFVLLPIAVMVYWQRRLRIKQPPRGIHVISPARGSVYLTPDGAGN